MAVKKKLFLFLMITPCILVFVCLFVYLEAKQLALKPSETNTDPVYESTKRSMTLPQEQEINELDPDCQCRHVVPKGLTLLLECTTFILKFLVFFLYKSKQKSSGYF